MSLYREHLSTSARLAQLVASSTRSLTTLVRILLTTTLFFFPNVNHNSFDLSFKSVLEFILTFFFLIFIKLKNENNILSRNGDDGLFSGTYGFFFSFKIAL